ncbi:MAG: T9SS type A sorting domain-containing protein, partial [Bacteroidia bacterium]|nr:T9SS type A sorting domain-containing protein [Bacteroidia bacterium]
KYVEIIKNSNLINVYNTNNTLYTSFAIPTPSNISQSVGYVSDNLFDTDPGIEYYMTTYEGTPPANVVNNFKIYNSDGSVLFRRDSASLYHNSGSGNGSSNFGLFNSHPIFFDGTSTKMRILKQIAAGNNYKLEFYNLPGSLTCADCSNGFVESVSSDADYGNGNGFKIFPNPASNEIKLKYSLGNNITAAKIKIVDINGQAMESFDVTSSFDSIYISDKYSNGLYFFQIIINDKIVHTEKIVIQK